VGLRRVESPRGGLADRPGCKWAIAAMVLYGVARGFSDASVIPILCQVISARYRATGDGSLNLSSTFTG
jgi:hypothetical protein